MLLAQINVLPFSLLVLWAYFDDGKDKISLEITSIGLRKKG